MRNSDKSKSNWDSLQQTLATLEPNFVMQRPPQGSQKRDFSSFDNKEAPDHKKREAFQGLQRV